MKITAGESWAAITVLSVESVLHTSVSAGIKDTSPRTQVTIQCKCGNTKQVWADEITRHADLVDCGECSMGDKHCLMTKGRPQLDPRTITSLYIPISVKSKVEAWGKLNGKSFAKSMIFFAEVGLDIHIDLLERANTYAVGNNIALGAALGQLLALGLAAVE